MFWVFLFFCLFLQVCKYFLEAIENNKYGWFWVCPSGGDTCMYRHALPPGFVLKKDKKKEEKEEEISLEELIEKEVRMTGENVYHLKMSNYFNQITFNTIT